MKKIIFTLLLLPSLVFGQGINGKIIANRVSGGTISVDTINAGSLFNLHQTTAGQTITVPSPGSTKTIDVVNIGSVNVTLSPGGTLSPAPAGNSRAQLRWTGAVWAVTMGGGGGVDTSAVHKAGGETITGVKTFIANPSVQTPILAVDAANKLYVDTKDGAKQDTATAMRRSGTAMTGNLDLGGNNAINANVVKVNDGGGVYNTSNNAQINLAGTGNISFTGTGISATTVPYLDASKNIVSSSVTPTELGYVHGVTSPIQTQLNAKGSGSVTTVSVTSANGVSGTVANPTTTPAITLTLGAITPTSVNGVTVSGSSTPTLAVTGTTNVSGTNTGDYNPYKGNIDLSANPNYPAGTIGDMYRVSVLGKVGGASGKALGLDDRILCIANSAGGTEAAVGENGTTPGWMVIRSLHPLATTALTPGVTVTVDFGNKVLINKSLTDSRTNITFTSSNNLDGSECLIEFSKTTVNNDTLTFTSAYKVMSEGLPQSSTSAIISSSSTGVFIISLKMLNSRLYATVKNYGN